jgi:putative acyl-CoA dehydrogenase
MTHLTHEVLNQNTPFVDVNLFETDARRLTRDVALALRVAALRQHAASAVFDTFCASRLGFDFGGGDAFDLLDARAPLDEPIARAMPGIH